MTETRNFLDPIIPGMELPTEAESKQALKRMKADASEPYQKQQARRRELARAILDKSGRAGE